MNMSKKKKRLNFLSFFVDNINGSICTLIFVDVNINPNQGFTISLLSKNKRGYFACTPFPCSLKDKMKIQDFLYLVLKKSYRKIECP